MISKEDKREIRVGIILASFLGIIGFLISLADFKGSMFIAFFFLLPAFILATASFSYGLYFISLKISDFLEKRGF